MRGRNFCFVRTHTIIIFTFRLFIIITNRQNTEEGCPSRFNCHPPTEAQHSNRLLFAQTNALCLINPSICVERICTSIVSN